MAAITYPATLPVPQTSHVTPAERRALSEAARPLDARALQRDRLEYERVVWPPMTAAKCETILAWWRETLTYGGAWFSAVWPLPRGMVTAVRKFREQPRWEYVPGGYWRLSALCEVRGVGELPLQPSSSYLFLDRFTDSPGTLLSAHTPDVAPAGFAYFTDSNMQSSGSAAVGIDHIIAGATAANSSPAFALSPSFPYTVHMRARTSDSQPSGSATFQLSFVPGTRTVFLYLERVSAESYKYQVSVGNGVDAAVNVTETFAGGTTPHTLSVLLEDYQFTVTFDGVRKTPTAYSSPSAFNALALSLVHVDGDGGYIDEVGVQQA